jgi:glutamate racemase
MKTNNIAVLDSGIGGLSVVSAIRKLNPQVNISYFADTANLPYGIKSPKLIEKLAIDMAQKAVKLSSCRFLIIACHTISVTCLDKIKKAVDVPVFGMVEPTLIGLKKLSNKNSIGIISTKATVLSRVYQKMGPKNLVEHAAGPLVSILEDSDLEQEDLIKILELLLPKAIKSCDALVIGCTHFSALINALKKVLKPSCIIVDAADELALMLKDELLFMGQGELLVYITDNPERFQKNAKRFIAEQLIIRGC